jgi:cytoskeletal protein RodZ
MGLDESEVSRLLRGDVPNDDPVWGEVSSFLNDVGTAYPAVPTSAFEGRHLAAIAHETRLVHSELRRPRQGAVKRLFSGSHRVLAGSVGAFLIALTAGVGVASALGINPLGQLFTPPPAASSVVPQATSPKAESSSAASVDNSDGPGTSSPEAVPGSVPTPTSLPTPDPTATKTPGSVGDEHKNSRATEKANNAATPTPHNKKTPAPHKTKTPAPPKATPSPPGKGKNG